MKNLLILSLAVLFLASCEKLNIDLHKKEKPCSVVAQDVVPASVVAAFQTKHPGGISAKKWFNKDDKGYAALFDNNGKDGLDFFDNDGNFQKEEIDGDNQQGNHQDKDEDKGCECETED